MLRADSGLWFLMAFLLPGRQGWRRPLGNSRDRPSRDFPGFKYLCLLPPTWAWLPCPASLPLRSGVSIFSPGCPNLIARLHLRRSRLLPKAQKCFMAPVWAGSGVFSKGCGCNGRGVLLLLLPGPDPKHPRTFKSPFPTTPGCPYTHSSQISGKGWEGRWGECCTPK